MDFNERILYLANKEHRECLRMLHKDFCLCLPSPIPISLGDFGTSGLNWEEDRFEIRLDKNKNQCYWMTPVDDCLHETGHYMHLLRNPKIKKETALRANLRESSMRPGYANIPSVAVIEFIAELTLIKFRLEKNKERTISRRTFIERQMTLGNLDNGIFLAAYYSYLSSPNLLKNISHRPVKEVYPIVRAVIEKAAPWMLEYDYDLFPKLSAHYNKTKLKPSRLP